MTKEKVSVVIPCYNLAEFLGDAIQSVLNQSVPCECIVVDDASTDDTPRICNEFGDQIIYVRNETNQHVSRSRNRGFAMSRGQYIMPLDADDMLGGPDTIRVLTDYLEANRLTDIVYGSMQVIEEDGKAWTSGWPPEHFSYETQLSGRDLIPYSALMRRQVWQRLGGYRVNFERVEDALFWTQAVAIGFIPKKCTEAITLLYRLRNDSLSHRVAEKPWHLLAPRKPMYTPYTYEPVKVSVIVSVHVNEDHEALLNTLDSIWAQTLPAWECIVVPVAHVFNSWVPPYVKILGIADNHSEAWTIGMNHATGETQLFVEAGCILENTFLEKSYLLWSEEHEVVCPRYEVSDDIEPIVNTCGSEDKMACASCSSKMARVRTKHSTNLTSTRASLTNPGAAEVPSETKLLVEFIGEGSWPIRGPVTGEMYYFSSVSGHKIKAVYESDARALVARYDTHVRMHENVGAPV